MYLLSFKPTVKCSYETNLCFPVVIYNVGSINKVSIVEVMTPPITTVASGLWTSAPTPVEMAIGKKPTASVTAVAITGIKRCLAAVRTESFNNNEILLSSLTVIILFEKDLKFLEDAFKQYYFDHFNLINVPDRASEREFGYMKFNTGPINEIVIVPYFARSFIVRYH